MSEFQKFSQTSNKLTVLYVKFLQTLTGFASFYWLQNWGKKLKQRTNLDTKNSDNDQQQGSQGPII